MKHILIFLGVSFQVGLFVAIPDKSGDFHFNP